MKTPERPMPIPQTDPLANERMCGWDRNPFAYSGRFDGLLHDIQSGLHVHETTSRAVGDALRYVLNTIWQNPLHELTAHLVRNTADAVTDFPNKIKLMHDASTRHSAVNFEISLYALQFLVQIEQTRDAVLTDQTFSDCPSNTIFTDDPFVNYIFSSHETLKHIGRIAMTDAIARASGENNILTAGAVLTEQNIFRATAMGTIILLQTTGTQYEADARRVTRDNLINLFSYFGLTRYADGTIVDEALCLTNGVFEPIRPNLQAVIERAIGPIPKNPHSKRTSGTTYVAKVHGTALNPRLDHAIPGDECFSSKMTPAILYLPILDPSLFPMQ